MGGQRTDNQRAEGRRQRTELQISDFGFRISNCRFRIADLGGHGAWGIGKYSRQLAAAGRQQEVRDQTSEVRGLPVVRLSFCV